MWRTRDSRDILRSSPPLFLHYVPESYGHWTALHLAATYGYVKVVSVLLSAGANVEAADTGGFTPLEEAAFNGHVEVVRALLSAGADKAAGAVKGWYTKMLDNRPNGWQPSRQIVRLLKEAARKVARKRGSSSS
ncbi:hypothetical protein HYH03_006746 [Edaphochlamys debaryana]|uniref:Uncharacterized protein n=1 Tax=Edaphochlamys debaryana TaxID=47281 RepID=A0A835Y242_9CHLO|nr:hypothetical protein HYH03_006746 [Edaphochlamys debaryana]|eukprot:KAG2495137.1 hypothetical protein HYH03_006746 [Edaphochlamys debaryana]